jgi:sugar O-acyltransferase (sialic acid O-acetyltransferase NeuD family)
VAKDKKLVLVGDSAFAEIAYEYFTCDSSYEVAAFAVEAAYLKRPKLFGLPVVPLEEVENSYPPKEHDVYVAVVYSQLNRLRTRLADAVKSKGFRLASYVSSRAFVWRNVKLGEHCFIFEDNTVQPFVECGDNVVLWSGNHVGHHSRIGDNCFISSHVVISGFCNIGANCFLGVNSALANNVTLGRDCWIGPGVTIKKDVAEDLVFSGADAEPSKVPAKRFFRIKESNGRALA